MKTPLKFTYLAVAACALSVSANAATIEILNLSADFSATGAGNPKTASGFTVTMTGTTTKTLSFTQTGDLDGGLGGNDTLTFDLIYNAYTGSTFDGTDVTLGTTQITPNTNNINWHNNAFEDGDTLSLEVANIVYTSSDSTIAFDGFTAIQPANYAATGAGDFDYYVGLLGATTIVGDPTFNASLTSNGTSPTLYFTSATQDPVRLRNVDFKFEISAIPEPGTYALLAGLTGLVFVMVRRRRA